MEAIWHVMKEVVIAYVFLGLPIIIYLQTKILRIEKGMVFREWHFTAYDFNEDILNRISDMEDETKRLLFEYTLKLRDRDKDLKKELLELEKKIVDSDDEQVRNLLQEITNIIHRENENS